MTEPLNPAPPEDTPFVPSPSPGAATFTVTFTGAPERNTLRLDGEGSLTFDGPEATVTALQHSPGAPSRPVSFRFALAEIARVGLHEGALVLAIRPHAEPASTFILTFYVASEGDAHRVMAILHPSNTGMRDDHPEAWRFYAALRGTPVFATRALLAANIIIFALMALNGVHPLNPDPPGLVEWGARLNPLIQQGQWWRMLTPMFVHIGLLHLLMNMWALKALGDFVERMFGPWRYLAIYGGAGLLGNVLSYHFQPEGIAAGASGAIFGIMGALVAFIFRRHQVIPRQVLTGLRGSAFSFISLNLVFGFLIPGIDNSAHLGGLAGGFLLGWLLARPLEGQEAARPWRPWREKILVAACAAVFVVLVVLGRQATAPAEVRREFFAQAALPLVTELVRENSGDQQAQCIGIGQMREQDRDRFLGQARLADGQTLAVEIRHQGDSIQVLLP